MESHHVAVSRDVEVKNESRKKKRLKFSPLASQSSGASFFGPADEACSEEGSETESIMETEKHSKGGVEQRHSDEVVSLDNQSSSGISVYPCNTMH